VGDVPGADADASTSGGRLRTRALDAVTREAGRSLGGHVAALVREEPPGPAHVVALWGAEAVPRSLRVGMRLAPDAEGVLQRVQRSAGQGDGGMTGPASGVSVPVVVEGRVWGALTVLRSGPPLPAGAADRLEPFAELLAGAIADAGARDRARELAREQTALRRIAELVARGAALQEVFAAVVSEASGLLGDRPVALARFERDRRLVVVATRDGPPVGSTGAMAGVAARVSVHGRPWGILSAASEGPPLPAGTENRLEPFAELVGAALAGSQARAELQALADEQAALRRIAQLTAQEASAEAVLQAVAAQASQVAGVEFGMVLRFVAPDGSTEIAALDGAPANFEVGMRAPGSGDGSVHRVWRTGRAARVDQLGAMAGRWPRMASRFGFSTSAGVPILLQGGLWGALIVAGREPLPRGIESKLTDFAELVGTTISAAQARGELRELVDEQAALRRVAELVARGPAPGDVVAAVATEASRLLGDRAMTLVRYEGAHELVVVASRGGPAPVGQRIRFEADTLPERVRREARAVRVDDYTRERDRELASAYGLAAAVAAPISVEGAVWGMLTATSAGPPLPAGTEHRLEQFAELVAAALANSQARAELQALADEQAALRRIAELTAKEAPAEEVLQAVAAQASKLAGVDFTTLLRYERDGSTEIVALDGAPEAIEIGHRAPGTGDGATQRVWRTGRAARIDDLRTTTGHWPLIARQFGFSTSVAVPILLQRGLWGALVVVGRDEPLPPAIEAHLADFAELASTAISAAQSRAALLVLADEQAALRRVAELVARGASLDEVFGATATEASTLLGDQAAALVRYGADGQGTVVASHGRSAPPRRRVPSGGATDAGRVRDAVTVPILVEGRLWGALSTSSSGRPLRADSEDRLVQFAELAGAAIANAENKASLNASRARVIATADETRRRLQRDLHDGAQQRLVHTLILLKLASDATADGRSAAELIEEALANAERANRELRDLVRGILPAALTRGGLAAGLESLVADLSLPVDVRVRAPRLHVRAETTAYFVVAEALTNVVKHARATRASVDVALDGDAVSILVRDDGIGGADLARGSGLTGLSDRVEANEGSLTVTSPRGGGTTVHAVLKLTGGG
jgi:signal transduction histidine kinase